MRERERLKYIKLILACIPGLIALIEFVVFWWKNNGLHTSNFDFWVAHPVHCLISMGILFVSLVLIEKIKD